MKAFHTKETDTPTKVTAAFTVLQQHQTELFVSDRIRSGEEVSLPDSFALINNHLLTSAAVMRGGEVEHQLDVNCCEICNGRYTFFQDVSPDNYITVSADEIVSYELQVFPEYDFLFTDCTLKDGRHLKLTTFHISKEVPNRDQYEIGVYELDRVLQDLRPKMIRVRMTNLSGFDMEVVMTGIVLTDIDEGCQLILSNATGAVMTILVSDDFDNFIYMEETGFGFVLTVKPVGMPFAELRIAVVK